MPLALVLLHSSCKFSQNSYDKIKRKALLAPNTLANDGFAAPLAITNEHMADRQMNKPRGNMFAVGGNVNAVVGGMEANGVCRLVISPCSMSPSS